MAEPAKKNQESGAGQQTPPRRFSLWQVLKKALYVLLGVYIFICSFNAGFHPNRVPEELRPAALALVTPHAYANVDGSFNAKLQLLRRLNKKFPQGTSLPKVKSDLAAMGFTLSEYDAVFRADNFICAITYRVSWEVDDAPQTIIRLYGGAVMRCRF